MEEKVIVTFDFEMDDEICGKICDKLTKIQTSIYIFDCFTFCRCTCVVHEPGIVFY